MMAEREGFWLPARLRETVLRDAEWQTYWLSGGALSETASSAAVAVRWPKLSPSGWDALLAQLKAARLPAGVDVAVRWGAALEQVRQRLAMESADMLPVLSACTGYSPEMLAAALWQGDLINPSMLAAALRFRPTWALARRWEKLPDLAGCIRFYPARRADRALALLRGAAPLAEPAARPELVLGFAAGNVPGNALLIAMLGSLAASGRPDAASPAVLARNSRHEPIFSPWVLSAVEAVDPELVASIAVLVWDYEDKEIQSALMRCASVMVAAAGDDTIGSLEALRARNAPKLRFHPHGHKASFAVVDTGASSMGGLGLAQIAHLAALDSSLWDQNGCLSARIHFVAGDAAAYAEALTAQMRLLGGSVPRGTTPLRYVHRIFDSYKALEGSGEVQVFSTWGDPFAVILDGRSWDAEACRRTVNACQGRSIVVRPVTDVMLVPAILHWLPAANLQSVSLAMGSDRVAGFAEAAGKAGVTAIRSLGRAAFPQLAYSWDGLLPLDMGHVRPPGHFATLEFDDLNRELQVTAERWGI